MASEDPPHNAGVYKGNDIDSDGDGIVDNAGHATTAGDSDTVDGLHASEIGGGVTRLVDNYSVANAGPGVKKTHNVTDALVVRTHVWGYMDGGSHMEVQVRMTYTDGTTETLSQSQLGTNNSNNQTWDAWQITGQQSKYVDTVEFLLSNNFTSGDATWDITILEGISG